MTSNGAAALPAEYRRLLSQDIKQWKFCEVLAKQRDRQVVCLQTAEGVKVAVKQYSLQGLTTSGYDSICNEIHVHKLLRKLDTVADLVGSFKYQRSAYIVTRYHSHRDLTQFMTTLGRQMTEVETANAVVLPLLYTLIRMHAHDIVHGDIKPHNIFINEHSRPVLGDFGMASQGTHEFRDRHFAGTVAYAAPEVFQRLRSCSNTNAEAISAYYHKRDIFAMGLVIADLMQGVHPFLHDQLHRSLPLKTSVKVAILTANPYISSKLSPEAQDFLQQCLVKNPAKRPRAWQLMTHPWLKNVVSPSHLAELAQRAKAAGESGVQRAPSNQTPQEVGFVSEDIFKVLLPSLAAHISASDTPLTGETFHAIMHCIAVAISLGCSSPTGQQDSWMDAIPKPLPPSARDVAPAPAVEQLRRSAEAAPQPSGALDMQRPVL